MSSLPDFPALIRELLDEQHEPASPSPTEDRVMDAAVRLIGDSGERRLTMDDVATRSRMARATVFRRFGSREELLRRTYSREIRRTLAEVRRAVEATDEPLAVGYATLVDIVCRHPITRQMARSEPDLAVEMWRTGTPSGFTVVRTFIEGLGERRDPPGAEILARLLFSFLLLPEATPSRADIERLVRDRELA